MVDPGPRAVNQGGLAREDRMDCAEDKLDEDDVIVLTYFLFSLSIH